MVIFFSIFCLCFFQFKINARAMLCHPFMTVFFNRKTICLDELLLSLLRNFIVPLDSSCSCSLACCCDHLLMKHSSTALLISQCSKFSHESLATLWFLMSSQRSADVEVKLGLGRKKIPGKLSKHCIF